MMVTCIDEYSFILVVNFCPCCRMHLGVINFAHAMRYDCPCAIFHTLCCQIYPYGHFHSQNEFSSMQIIASTWKIPVIYKIIVNEYNLIHFESFIYVTNFIQNIRTYFGFMHIAFENQYLRI